MKLKMRQVVNAVRGLNQFAAMQVARETESEDAKAREANKATAKESYAVAKLMRKLSEEARDFSKVQDEIIKKYGEKVRVPNPGGGERDSYRVLPDKFDDFEKELEELLDQEVSIEGIVLIPWSYVEKVTPTPAVLVDLDPVMEQPKD